MNVTAIETARSAREGLAFKVGMLEGQLLTANAELHALRIIVDGLRRERAEFESLALQATSGSVEQRQYAGTLLALAVLK